MSIEKINDAVAILSEHCEHYMVIAVTGEDCDEVELQYSCPYIVEGLCTQANSQINCMYELDTDYEYASDEEEDDEDV
mgnify:CR=1 FL=1